LGRLLVIESTQPRQLVRHEMNNAPLPPQSIIDWCKAVASPIQRAGNLSDLSAAEMRAVTVPMVIDTDCRELLRTFEIELNQLKDEFEPEGLDVLLGRTFEKSLRLAMIAAKAIDPNAQIVKPDHLKWAIDFVRHFDMNMVRAVRKNRVASQVDQDIKKLVEYVKFAKRYADDKRYKIPLSAGAMPRGKLLKLMKMKVRDFEQLIDTAIGSGLITMSPGIQFGDPSPMYWLGDVD
jgi:hypothetical protein